MKQLGYGDGYAYDHDTADAFSAQNYFPDGIARQAFYDPKDRGFERELRRRLDHWAALRRQAASEPGA
jgi:putative ATPase